MGPPSAHWAACPWSCPVTCDSAAVTHTSHIGRFILGSENVEPKEETGQDVAQDCCLQTSMGQLHARERDQKDRAYIG